MLEDKKIWKTQEITVTEQTESKVLSLEEKSELLCMLIADARENLEKIQGAYEIMKNTDLSSILTRSEQNIKQLKKIQFSLIED